MTLNPFNTLLRISLCGLISTPLSLNAYSSQKIVANWAALSFAGTASISFRVSSAEKDIRGDLITIAISGPVNQQISCSIDGKAQCCRIQHLMAGNYRVTAMGLTDDNQHYSANAAETPVQLRAHQDVAMSIIYVVKQRSMAASSPTNLSVKNPA